MPTLTPLTVGNAQTTSPTEPTPNWDSAPNGALGDSSDSTYGYVSTNASGTYSHGWAMDNVDADFDSMLTLSIVLRYAWGSAPSNTTWTALNARVRASDGTVLAAFLSGGSAKLIVSNITTTTPTNSASVAFNYVNTSATKSQWDTAAVEIEIVRSKTKGGDTSEQRVFEATLTGTYVANSPKVLLDAVWLEIDYSEASGDRTATDTLTLTESVARQTDLHRTASDALSFSDSVSAETAGNVVRTVTDSVVLSESVDAAAAIMAVLTEALSFSDSVEAGKAIAVALVDTLTLAESVSAVTSVVEGAATDSGLSAAAVAGRSGTESISGRSWSV